MSDPNKNGKEHGNGKDNENENEDEIEFEYDYGNKNGNAPVSEDVIAKWAATLPTAKITRWGGMISTPDQFRQDAIRKCLEELECPAGIIDTLLLNAHEKRWPLGLRTIQVRQLESSKAKYDQFVCKRLPDMQAVLILHCDNKHMPEDLAIKPGIVMAFAYGVE